MSHPYADSALEASAAAGVSPHHVAQATLLTDRRGLLLAVFPADHVLVLDLIHAQLGRTMQRLPQAERAALFPDCEPDSTPAVADAYGLRAIIDATLAQLEDLYLCTGSHTDLIEVGGRALRLLQNNPWQVRAISRPTSQAADAGARPQRAALRHALRDASVLPVLSETALRIAQLRNNPYAGARDLVGAVESEPTLANQLIRYAGMALFAYPYSVRSVREAVNRVLGYDLALQVAWGIAAGRSLGSPPGGPPGLRRYWRSGVYSGLLTQALGNLLPPEQRPRPGIAYVSGLLHDVGYLLLAQLFPAEFSRLSDAAEGHPELPVLELERQFLDVTHMELGARLLDAWNLPAEVVVAAREHHNGHYSDLHHVYPRLVDFADALLRDASASPAGDAPEALTLTASQARQALATVLKSESELEALAAEFTA